MARKAVSQRREGVDILVCVGGLKSIEEMLLVCKCDGERRGEVFAVYCWKMRMRRIILQRRRQHPHSYTPPLASPSLRYRS